MFWAGVVVGTVVGVTGLYENCPVVEEAAEAEVFAVSRVVFKAATAVLASSPAAMSSVTGAAPAASYV